jgi:hypothetical protein
MANLPVATTPPAIGVVTSPLASYPLDHESKVGGERFELPQPKPRLYRPLVSPMNSPPLG